MVWKPIFRRISPKLKDRLLRPWLYPHVEPTVNFPDIQTENLPDDSIVIHTDLDEDVILEALKEKE